MYLCTTRQHNPWLVLVAVVICLASAITGMLLLRRGIARGDRRWQALAGLVTGFGMWCTHFIAMLGYRPGLAVAWRLMPTVASLVLALVMMSIGFVVAACPRNRVALPLGAVIASCGLAGMHYLGVSAIDLPAQIRLDPALLWLSLVLAVLPMVGALQVLRTGGGIAGACLLLVLAVTGLHFAGMAAIRLVPTHSSGSLPLMLSPQTLAVAVGNAAGLVVMLCIIALVHLRRIDDLVLANERRFNVLTRGISDCALYMLTPDGTVASWNVGAERLTGYTTAEVVGSPVEIFYSLEDRRASLPAQALAKALNEGIFHGEGWCCRKDGSRYWADVTVEPIRDEAGRMVGFAKIIRDNTRLKEDQERLAAMQVQRDTALDHMAQGLVLFDADRRLLVTNQRLCDLWHVARDAVPVGLSLAELVATLLDGRAPANRLLVMARLHQLLTPPKDEVVDAVVLDCQEDFVLSVSCRPLADGGWVATFTDITERRRHEVRIAHMALHDHLTDLPNREGMGQWFDAKLDMAVVRGLKVATVLIDLGALRAINDRYGHSFGDSVVREMAQRMDAVCNDATCNNGARVGRAEGDAFIAGLMFADDAELHGCVDRLRACLALPVIDGDLVLSISPALGIAVFPAHGTDRDTLFSNADLALQRAKTHHSNRLCIYDLAMDEGQRSRRQLAEDLRGAAGRGEMRVVFQPQHALASSDLVGYEALVRWDHPVRGEVGPAEFIPIAEETGDILEIGEWVLREAARIGASWSNDLKIAVNLSPVQFEQEDLLQRITAALLDTGFPARRLEFEITESAIFADRALALHMLRRIKALGISIAIDDFGTGHSSLDTLHVFPFDKIKIDRFFLRHAASNHQSAAIVRAVLALGRGLGIPVLAEGIETAEQLAFLAAEGCEQGQGYYFGRPRTIAADDADPGRPLLRSA